MQARQTAAANYCEAANLRQSARAAFEAALFEPS